MYYLLLALVPTIHLVSPGCVPGEFVSHPKFCEKYLVCSNGLFIEMPCAPGTVFNPKINVCDWPYNVDCTSRYDTETTTKSRPSTPPRTTSPSSETPLSTSPTPTSSTSSEIIAVIPPDNALGNSSNNTADISSIDSIDSPNYPSDESNLKPKIEKIQFPTTSSTTSSVTIAVIPPSIDSPSDASSDSSRMAPDDSSENSNSNSHCKDSLAPLIHLLRKSTNSNFYTPTATEAEYALARYGYIDKGIIGSVATTCQCDKYFKPIYRVYRPVTSANPIDDQWYTSSDADVHNATTNLGYFYEGIRFYCPGKSGECKATTPLHSYLKKGIHVLSTIIDKSADAVYEGILCYIWL